jgi:hypothetical protein
MCLWSSGPPGFGAVSDPDLSAHPTCTSYCDAASVLIVNLCRRLAKACKDNLNSNAQYMAEMVSPAMRARPQPGGTFFVSIAN